MVNLFEIDNCPSCKSIKIKKIISAIDYLVTKKQFDIYECTNCSLRFTSPLPDENEILKYYESDEYISHAEQPESIINRIYKIVQKITLISKRRYVEKQFQGRQGELLDIGCGTGDFLNIIKSSGWKVSGVERNKTARDTARAKIDQDILSPLQFCENNNKFDVITLWHSLEHLHNLRDYVKKIVNSLNQNGLLVIAVPNYKSIDAKSYQSNWAAYDVPRHLYHFSFRSMDTLFKEYDFEIINFKQLPFDSFYVSLLSETMVKEKQNILLALWIGIRSFIAGLINNKKGSSILYVLKKIAKEN